MVLLQEKFRKNKRIRRRSRKNFIIIVIIIITWNWDNYEDIMQLWFNFIYADGRLYFLSSSTSTHVFIPIWLSIYIIIYLIDGDCDNISGFISSVLSFFSYCVYSFTTKFTSIHLFLMSSLFSAAAFPFVLTKLEAEKVFVENYHWSCGQTAFGSDCIGVGDFNCNYRTKGVGYCQVIFWVHLFVKFEANQNNNI